MPGLKNRLIASALFVIAVLFAPGTLRAGTIHVTTNLQSIADDGQCSLQEAIYSANFDFGVAPSSFNPLVTFNSGCEPGSGDDVIVLQAGVVYGMGFILNDPYNPLGPTATPIILSNITIEGNGAQLVRANPFRNFASPNFRAFAVANSSFADPADDLNVAGDGHGNLTISNLYIKGFTAKGGDGASGGGGGLGAGGAIYVKAAVLTVENSTFEDNGAGGGSGGATGGPFSEEHPNAGFAGGGGGLSGNGGRSEGSAGGGGGGARGNGAAAGGVGAVPGGGGGGTLANGQAPQGGNGGAGGFRCGGSGGAFNEDGANACDGGGGGGGGNPSTVLDSGFVAGEGGNGGYGGGGGGAPEGQSAGHGGFGGGGGSAESIVLSFPSGGNGGFGGGGGSLTGGNLFGGPGMGGSFAGNGSLSVGGGGGAGLGGAIFSDFGNVTIHNSTFKGNYVLRGLGVDNTQSGDDGRDAGGAIFAVDGSLTVLNSTLALNESTGDGGGIVVYRSSRGGLSASFTLRNTIFAINTSNPGKGECYFLNSVSAEGSGNLIMNNSIDSLPFDDPHACLGQVSSDNPLLGALQINAPGNTPTMSIDANSPAASNADAATSLATDQRGVSRPRGEGPDIGAYEFGNQPPTASCRNVTVPAAAGCVADASIDNGSSDPEGDTFTLTQSPAGPYSLGTTTVTLTATDSEGASSSCTGTVTVTDTEAPTITPTLGSTALNPTNHSLVNVGLGATATDACSAAPTSFTVKVFGDEDDQTPTSRNTIFSPDAANIGIGSLRLRGERVDSADGRVYLIVVRGSDGSGNSGFACSSVVVPHNSSLGSLTTVNSQAATAKVFCEANSGAAPAGYFVVGDGPVIGPKQ
jgi:hypothetical protein